MGVLEDEELSFLVRVPSVCMFGVGPWARAHLIRAWSTPSPGLLALVREAPLLRLRMEKKPPVLPPCLPTTVAELSGTMGRTSPFQTEGCESLLTPWAPSEKAAPVSLSCPGGTQGLLDVGVHG